MTRKSGKNYRPSHKNHLDNRRAHRLRRRTPDLDQVQTLIENIERKKAEAKAEGKGDDTMRTEEDDGEVEMKDGDVNLNDIADGEFKDVHGKVIGNDISLPGLGRHFCLHCSKYFIDSFTLIAHKKSKTHKKMLKRLQEPKYTQRDAEAAAGMSAPR